MKFLLLLPVFMLGACNAAPLAANRSQNAADPAVAEALGEPIMTDLQMRAAAAPDAIRPADQPGTLQIPADNLIGVQRGGQTLAGSPRPR